jgi:hypothetical protein
MTKHNHTQLFEYHHGENSRTLFMQRKMFLNFCATQNTEKLTFNCLFEEHFLVKIKLNQVDIFLYEFTSSTKQIPSHITIPHVAFESYKQRHCSENTFMTFLINQSVMNTHFFNINMLICTVFPRLQQRNNDLREKSSKRHSFAVNDESLNRPNLRATNASTAWKMAFQKLLIYFDSRWKDCLWLVAKKAHNESVINVLERTIIDFK